MVLEALEDAGLTLADVDGVCHPESAVAFAEYLGVHPTFVESTMTGGSSYEVHVEHAAAAIAAGVCDVVVSVYAATPRSDRTQGRRAGAAAPGGAQPDGRVGPALRTAHADGPLRAGRGAPHARVRDDVRAARPDRGQHTRVGRPQPAGPLPRPDHHRRRPGLAPAGEPAASPRLLPRHRRRRRLRHDQRRTCPVAAQAPGVRARRRHVHRPHGHQPDARPHHDAGRGVGRPRLRDGRPRAGRRRRADGLRQLHHHRAPAPRGPRVLQEGRGRPVRRRRPPRSRAARWP